MQYPITSINAKFGTKISVFDRNMQFGDGVFDTCKISNGFLECWNLHWSRLLKGLNKLGIEPPKEQLLLDCISQSFAKINNGKEIDLISKIIISRGESSRGYACKTTKPNIIVQLTPAPSHEDTPLKLCFSPYMLAENKQLAGIKHCNRLEQVLASNALPKEYDGAIMCNYKNQIIATTNSNIFAIKEKNIYTPNLANCGIEGTVRSALLNPNITITNINKVELINYDAIIITNSVYGIKIVESIEQHKYNIAHDAIDNLLQKWQAYKQANLLAISS